MAHSSSRSVFHRLPSAMITPGMTIRTRSVLLVTVPVLLAVGLALLWYRGQRVLGLDAYYYVEYTKELAQSWPSAFGSNWPRGYPLIAAWVTHLGPSPFAALTVVSFVSLLGLLVAAVKLLPRDLHAGWSAFAVLCALCSIPAVPLLLGMPMSELPFAAMLLGAVYFVKHWPARWAVWMSLFLGFGSFCIRYAGIFMFGLLALFFVIYFEELRDGRRLRFFGGWYAFFAVLSAFLLWTNVHATGHLSGADRGWGGGAAVIPEQLAHLGWAAIGALSSTRLKDLVGVAWPGLLIGWMVMGLVGSICARAVVSPKQPMARPLALLVLGYLGAFVMMRAARHFPDISEPRYFVPVLFPLALVLLLEVRLHSRRLLGAAATAAVLLGAGLSFRGVSEATYGDVAFARSALDAELEADDVIQVNGPAVSLSAYYPNAVEWPPCGEEMDEAVEEADFLVVAARRTRRGETAGRLDACGRELVAAARRSGYVVWKTSGPSVILRPAYATASSGRSHE